MMARGLPFPVLAALWLAGCADPSLTRRFCCASEGAVLDAAESAVEISVFAMDPGPADARATLVALSDRGQAALVEAVAGKSATAPEILATVGGRLGAGSAVGIEEDRTTVRKRLILSAARSNTWAAHPADRIHSLRYHLSNLKGGTFASWNRFTTEYATVDLGKVTLAQSVSGSLGITGGPGAGAPVPVTASGSVEAARNLTEEVSLRQRYINLTGILKKEEATLVQEGVVGIDLAGNAAVDVEIAVPACEYPAAVAHLGPLKKEGQALAQDKVQVSRRWIRFAKEPRDVTLAYQASYRLRHVVKNEDTILEGDDSVRWITGDTKREEDVVIVRRDELGPFQVWFLERDGDGVSLEGSWGGDLQFASFEEVQAFHDWLRETAEVQKGQLHLAGRRLLLGGKPLGKAEVPGLRPGRDSIPCEG